MYGREFRDRVVPREPQVRIDPRTAPGSRIAVSGPSTASHHARALSAMFSTNFSVSSLATRVHGMCALSLSCDEKVEINVFIWLTEKGSFSLAVYKLPYAVPASVPCLRRLACPSRPRYWRCLWVNSWPPVSVRSPPPFSRRWLCSVGSPALSRRNRLFLLPRCLLVLQALDALNPAFRAAPTPSRRASSARSA